MERQLRKGYTTGTCAAAAAKAAARRLLGGSGSRSAGFPPDGDRGLSPGGPAGGDGGKGSLRREKGCRRRPGCDGRGPHLRVRQEDRGENGSRPGMRTALTPAFT